MLCRSLAALALLISLVPGVAQSMPNLQEQYTGLRQQLQSARKAGDKAAVIKTALAIEKLVHGTPRSIAALAQAYAAAGDADHSLSAMGQLADMGQSADELLSDEAISALNKFPQYASQYATVVKRFAANKTPISHAITAFSLADPGVLAEDIDYDPHSKYFFITSVLEKKIIRVTSEGKAADFAQSPSHWPMLAIKVDPKRGVVWATEAALDGFTAASQSDWERSALLCFDLGSGKMLRRIEGPAKSALGDMVLTAEGDIIVSDGAGGGVYLYRASSNRKSDLLERIDDGDGDFFSPQTPAMHPDGRRIFVPDYARGIAILDPATKKAIWLDGQKKYALNGIDGLYFDHGSLVATQNGTSPERVVRFQLDPALARIISEEIIERATPTLGDPTHGVVVGDTFYYIANSGWSELDEHGNLKAGSKLTPGRIMQAKLR